MKIRKATAADLSAWVAMRVALYGPAEELRREAERDLADPDKACFVAEDVGRLVGFVELSLRDVAEGCDTSPVGYVEGWYVDASRRRDGIGRKLVAAGEAWARERGCTEMASDALIENDLSLRAHGRLGYGEVERSVHFRKALALVLRSAQPRDVSAIRELLHATWVDTYSSVVPVSVIDEVTAAWHAREKLEKEIKGGSPRWLLAEDETGLVGVASAALGADGVIALGRLYVQPARQRVGVGNALLTRIVDSFPGASTVRLEVEEKNPKGRAFYRKHGFREFARLRQDLGPVEAYVLALEKRL